MVLRDLKNEGGYTIVEVLVSITIVSIVLGIAGSVFFFINQQMIQWRSNTEFYSNYAAIEQRVFEDMLSAINVDVQDTAVVLNGGLQSQKTYSIRSSPLLVNGLNTEIYPMDSLVVSFEPLNAFTNQVLVWRFDQVKDRRKLSQQYMLSSRKPVLWNPIK